MKQEGKRSSTKVEKRKQQQRDSGNDGDSDTGSEKDSDRGGDKHSGDGGSVGGEAKKANKKSRVDDYFEKKDAAASKASSTKSESAANDGTSNGSCFVEVSM